MSMDIKFSKDSGNSEQEAHGEKKNQNALLVLLLVLVGGFTYIYFFTDLIKPLETPETAEIAAPAPQIVKIPLPARDGSPVVPGVEIPESAEPPKTAATTPVTPAAPAAKPTVPTKSVQAPATKPAAQTKPVPAPAVKKSIQAKAPNAAKEKNPSTAPWSLLAGNYVLEEALAADMGRVRKAGFKPAIKPDVRKKTMMSRLFVSEHNDRTAAQSTLEKLKRHTSDAFVLEQGGIFGVYAGSYLQKEAANSERERLKGAGINSTVQQAVIAIPTQSLTIGPFKNKKEAETALGRLKSAGIKATLSQK